MANQLRVRPFQNYRAAVTDPDYFYGHSDLLRDLANSPMEIRILLGGRRLGKTSLLHAIEWTLLSPSSSSLNQVFPVYINLRKEAPDNLENFFYILVACLRRATTRWENASGDNWRERYRTFLSQISGAEAGMGFLKLKVVNPDHERKLNKDNFEVALWEAIRELQSKNRYGVCFLFDEGDYFVSKPWANDALSYFRALKDSSDAMKPFLGLILTGYRGVRDYKHRIGSALYNIGSIVPLGPLANSEAKLLIDGRCAAESTKLDTVTAQFVLEIAGGHPYLTNQVLTAVLDRAKDTTLDSLRQTLVMKHKEDFADWWNVANSADGFGPHERAAYQCLLQKKNASVSEVAKAMRLTEFDALEALDSLVATGVAFSPNHEYQFTLGAGLFAEWVVSQGFQQT